MKKIITRSIFFGIIVILGFFIKIEIPSTIVNTLYTVVGIMFSVGIGLVVSFNLHGIVNKKFIKRLRENLEKVRNRYILFLALSTIAFLVFECLCSPIVKFSLWKFNLFYNFSIPAIGVLLYSISYFVINFNSIQKLSDQVFDEVNK